MKLQERSSNSGIITVGITKEERKKKKERSRLLILIEIINQNKMKDIINLKE